MIPAPKHFGWQVDNRVATITLNRPERKNSLTFESYQELIETFRALVDEKDIRAVVLTGAGGNFCSGGDVEEIIGPLVAMQEKGDRRSLEVHDHDRRSRHEHARLSATDRGGRGRHLCRRGRDSGDGQ